MAAMKSFDVIVVGAGPAGSSCARSLVAGGAKVAILDRAEFPRLKLCAGWITPAVVADLGLDIEAYPYRFNTFDHLLIHWKSLTFKVKTTQHSIRRYEFDDYLLKRSGAAFHVHNVKRVQDHHGWYEIDGEFRSRFIVGAGGTRCPVYRSLFRDLNPRARQLQIATYEHEFPYLCDDERCHLWFLDEGLPGYSWYVPKANGYVNCGVGGYAEKIKNQDQDIKSHWNHLVDVLSQNGLVRNGDLKPKGYSYYLRGNVEVVRMDNALLTGDAVGLATVDLGEGIGPAVKSGQLAARAILQDEDYSLGTIPAFSPVKPWLSDLLERIRAFRKRRQARDPGTVFLPPSFSRRSQRW